MPKQDEERERLTDDIVAKLEAPKSGNAITWDAPDRKGRGWTAGFGIRVTAAGAKAFILDYRTKTGKQRRYTIGSPPDWNVTAARDEAKSLRASVDKGGDPQGEKNTIRGAPTVSQLCDDFAEKHFPNLRARTEKEYRRMIEKNVRPALGTKKVADVSFDDIQNFHRKITREDAPYVANRVVAMLSKMFALAVRWKWRPDNPAKGVQRNAEVKRKRYLSAEESARLWQALAKHSDQDAANVLRLLLLTGARKGEVLAMRWDQLDLKGKPGKWKKPGHTTKQKTEHEVPLNGPARLILSNILAEADKNKAKSEYVFLGQSAGHRAEIKRDWAAVCKAAQIKGARMHDLRHTYASLLVSDGVPLPTIGALLGHSNPVTTARYAHLYDDAQREATDKIADVLPFVRSRGAR